MQSQPPTCSEHVSCPLAAIAVDLIEGLGQIKSVADSQKSLNTSIIDFKKDLVHILLTVVLACVPVGAGFTYFLVTSATSIQSSFDSADAQLALANNLANKQKIAIVEADQKSDRALVRLTELESNLEAALGKNYGIGQQNHASISAVRTLAERIDQNTSTPVPPPPPPKPRWFRKLIP